jgi:hypothetical protein
MMNHSSSGPPRAIPWLALAVMFFTPFWFGPWSQLHGLRLLPGDLVDGRFGHYFHAHSGLLWNQRP